MMLMDVFVVDRHPMMRFGIKTYLGASDDVRIVGDSGDGEQALRLIEDVQPDLVILGLNPTGEVDGIELCRQIKVLPDPPQVLVHAAYNFPDDLASCFLAGADSYIHKSTDSSTLLDAVRSTAAGKGPWIAGEGIGEPRSRISTTSEGVNLTARETQVLGLILHRYSYTDIAQTLYVSPNTVKNHVSKIFKKFGVESRKELLSKAELPVP